MRRNAIRVSVLCGVLSACVPHPVVVTDPTRIVVERGRRETPRRVVQWYDDFWRAIVRANFPSAWTIAATRDERQFAEVLQSMVNGDFDETSRAVIPLLSSDDTLIRNAAHMTYSALLSSRSQWRQLGAFADSIAPDTVARRARDLASVERWAPAFGTAKTVVQFTDSIATLPLMRTALGMPVVQVRVNGVVQYFWLDTGASISMLSSSVAAASGVTITSLDTLALLTTAGRIPARPAITRSIQFGPLIITDVPSMIVDTANFTLRASIVRGGPETLTHIDGVIGVDLIRQVDLTIDDAHQQVIVRKPVRRATGLGSQSRNLFWFGVPIVTLLSERGTPLHFTLDTGAEESYGTRALVTNAGIRFVTAERRSVNGFGGTTREQGLVVPRMRLFADSIALVFRNAFLYSAQYPTIFELDGTLGSDMGRGGSLRIDMTNGRFEVRP